MSYSKRQHPCHIVSVRDTRGEWLYPQTPAPFFRCEDRPRRLPADHPMATHRVVTPVPALFTLTHPLRSELVGRVSTVMIVSGLAGVLFGLLSLAGWL
jgi:hypothetical protein